MCRSAAPSGAPNPSRGPSSRGAIAGERPAHPVTFQVDRATVFPAGTALEQLPCSRGPPGIAGGSNELDLDYVLSFEGDHAMAEFLQLFMRTHAPLEIIAFRKLAGQVKHGAVGSAA